MKKNFFIIFVYIFFIQFFINHSYTVEPEEMLKNQEQEDLEGGKHK